MDFSVISDNLSYLLLGAYPDGPLGGAALTLLLASLSGLASAVLGLVLGVALAVLPGKPRLLLVALLGFFRAIPVLMLIFWTYFLLPIVFHVDVPALATVVCALSLIGGAYLAHSVYAGIHSLPAGQWAAARALGLRPWQVLRLVILPQALPVMLPSFLNQWVSLIKDTSLAYVIGVGELSFVATQVSNRVMVHPTEIFLFVALLYFLLCTSLDLAAAFLARRRRAQAAAGGSGVAARPRVVDQVAEVMRRGAQDAIVPAVEHAQRRHLHGPPAPGVGAGQAAGLLLRLGGSWKNSRYWLCR